MLLEQDVVFFQDGIRYVGQVGLEQLGFAFGIQDGQPLLHLVADDALGEVHPLFEEGGHLPVDALDSGAEFFQFRVFVHIWLRKGKMLAMTVVYSVSSSVGISGSCAS